MNGIKADPDIKMEGGITPSGSGYMDDDFYEDTGELSLPPKDQPKDVWVTRIPKWLYEAVSKFDDLADGRDDEEITIGEVLAFQDKQRPGNLSKTEPMRMFFHNKHFEEKKMPQAYQLEMTPASKEVLGNTYIFSEKDLPGYKPASQFGGRNAQSFNKGAVQDPNARVQKRSQYKKAIPKQTTLVGHATREYNANALPTAQFLAFNKTRIQQAIQGRQNKVNLLVLPHDTMMHEANQQAGFKSFVQPKQPKKTQLNKAARIAENDLLDLLHRCFDEYTYWSMKALKQRTKQPEAYLRETLERIADMIKSGPYASHWKRQESFNHLRDMAGQHQGLAPQTEGADGDDDDDAEEEMEDVI